MIENAQVGTFLSLGAVDACHSFFPFVLVIAGSDVQKNVTEL